MTDPIVAHGLAVGLDSTDGLLFDATKPYRYCRICGVVYQTERDRNPPERKVDIRGVRDLEHVLWQADVYERQIRWSVKHAGTHTNSEHELLAMSGLYMMPEAAEKLSAFGIISIRDLVMDDETSDALRKASPIPTNDVEG